MTSKPPGCPTTIQILNNAGIPWDGVIAIQGGNRIALNKEAKGTIKPNEPVGVNGITILSKEVTGQTENIFRHNARTGNFTKQR